MGYGRNSQVAFVVEPWRRGDIVREREFVLQYILLHSCPKIRLRSCNDCANLQVHTLQSIRLHHVIIEKNRDTVWTDYMTLKSLDGDSEESTKGRQGDSISDFIDQALELEDTGDQTPLSELNRLMLDGQMLQDIKSELYSSSSPSSSSNSTLKNLNSYTPLDVEITLNQSRN